MNELSKKKNKLILANSSSNNEKRSIHLIRRNSKSLNMNETKNLNNYNNELDSFSSYIKSKKNISKNEKNKNKNLIFNIKNASVYNRNIPKINNDINFLNENEITNKWFKKQNNNIFENYIEYQKNNKNNVHQTEIFLKKVRFHNFIESKKNYDKRKIKKQLLNNDENDQKDNNGFKFQFYLPVQGILYQKNNNNNLKVNEKKRNLFIVEAPNFIKNKTSKTNSTNIIEGKEAKNKSSLPFIQQKNNNKNKSYSILYSKNVMNKNRNLKFIKRFKKLTNFNVISEAGSVNGKTKINQDSYFIVPQIDNLEEIKIFGVFDGHGENGEKLSQEIKEFFKNYFLNLCGRSIFFEDDKNFVDNFFIKTIKAKKDAYHKYNSTKYKSNKIKLNESGEINLQNITMKIKEKENKINQIYNSLILNTYSEIFSSYKKLDEILHNKYSNSNICHLSGSTSLIIFLFNSKNCNKIISSNLGDSKIILISQTNEIKELNSLHTLYNLDEKKRILEHGGVINPLEVGPLRIWLKNKKYPGLAITRSFGDFESDSLGVLSIPDIKEYDLDTEQVKILIFGTDGVWKFLSNEKIRDIALSYYEHNDSEGATQKIKETANYIWKIKNPKGIADITVFVLFFK